MSGREFTLELLSGRSKQCTELLRMSRDAFIRPCALFRERGWLKDSKHIEVEEKMAIFFMIVGHNQRYVVIKRRFQHSTQTIHKVFHEVLKKMMLFAKEVIVPTSFNPNPNIPGNHRRLRRTFKGAVGALDGTLIHAVAPVDEQQSYRGRGRGDCYQNVLAICDFNMIFTYVVVGWEGSAHDSRVLTEAISNPDMKFPLPPPGICINIFINFVLLTNILFLQINIIFVMLHYANTRGFMAPYRNVRYWLGDFRRGEAGNKYEKFNHSHAKLRNVIERAYGILKARFSISKRMAPFSLDVQGDIVLSCFAIHNFIRKEGLSDEIFSGYDQSNEENVEGGDADAVTQLVQAHGSTTDQQYMANLREQIAGQL